MEKYALVIGIPTYKSPYFGDLPKTTREAADLAEILQNHGGFHITPLPSQGTAEGFKMTAAPVTADQFWTELETFIQRARGKDALIYFTGHGFTVTKRSGKSVGYLATSDCGVAGKDGKITKQDNGIELDELRDVLLAAEFSSLVLLLDCCHSGSVLENGVARASFASLEKTDYFVMAACREFEAAQVVRSQDYSVFSGAVIRGLAPENQDKNGEISCNRLFDVVRQEVGGRLQEPMHLGGGGGIPLVCYRQSNNFEVVNEMVCPFQGLQAFTPETKQFFFGRKAVVEQLRQKVEQHSFVALIGASGSGKSSVVRAGLVPWLMESGWLVLGPLTPDVEPMAELRRVFCNLFHRSGEKHWVSEQIDKKNLEAIVEKINRNILLVVDQFEQLFTVTKKSDRKPFIERLTSIPSISKLRILITMRVDFMKDCLSYKSLEDTLNSNQYFFLSDLQKEELKDAIIQPAKKCGYRFSEGLVELILKDIERESNCLPLLQFALQELWQRRDKKVKCMTVMAYNNLGQIKESLNRHAEEVYSGLRNRKEQDLAKLLFLKLVRTGSSGEKDIRRPLRKSELSDFTNMQLEEHMIVEVMEYLVNERLLLVREEQGMVYYYLSHEALMDSWRRLSDWLEEDREVRRLVDNIEEEWRDWKDKKENMEFHLAARNLRRVEEVERNGGSLDTYLTSPVQIFIKKSKEYLEQKEWERLKKFKKPKPPEDDTKKVVLPVNEALLRSFLYSSHELRTRLSSEVRAKSNNLMTLLQLMTDGSVDTPEERQAMLNECYEVALNLLKTVEINDKEGFRMSEKVPKET